MTIESKKSTNLGQKVSSKLLEPILQRLNVDTSFEAAMILDVRPSVFYESEKQGRISDEIYIALARHGIDIRELISKKAPIEIVELLSEIFGVEPEASVIAQALGVRNEDITLCEKLDYVTNKLCIALAGKGYDIREFWMNTASLEQ